MKKGQNRDNIVIRLGNNISPQIYEFLDNQKNISKAVLYLIENHIGIYGTKDICPLLSMQLSQQQPIQQQPIQQQPIQQQPIQQQPIQQQPIQQQPIQQQPIQQQPIQQQPIQQQPIQLDDFGSEYDD